MFTLAYPLVKLLAVLISPLGMECTAPSKSLRTVRLKFISSTAQSMSATLTQSPILYWSSSGIKMPASMSLIKLWAPKPTAMPKIPSPASIAVTFTPNSGSMVKRAKIVMMIAPVLTKNEDRVLALAGLITSMALLNSIGLC